MGGLILKFVNLLVFVDDQLESVDIFMVGSLRHLMHVANVVPDSGV